MKIKKILSLATISALAISVVGCSSSNEENNKIIVGASASPHAEILEVIKPELEEKGYELEIKVFNDYVLPNTALDEGSIDANYFQHVPFLEQTVEEKGYELTYTDKIHLEPIGFYSDKIKSLDEIKEGAKIAIPNDPTNGARALRLLEEHGLIKVAEGELVGAKDITENPKNLEIVEMAAEQLPSVLPEVEGAIINTNYALGANLNPTEDAIVSESKDSPYSNVLACKEENKDSEKIKALSEALTSETVKEFIETEYEGSIVPSF